MGAPWLISGDINAFYLPLFLFLNNSHLELEFRSASLVVVAPPFYLSVLLRTCTLQAATLLPKVVAADATAGELSPFYTC